MCKRELCRHCKTGRRTYEIDGKSDECPYIYCHNGRKCGMYKKMNKPKKESVLRGFVDWLVLPHPGK